MHISPNGKKYVGITSINPEDRWEKGHGYRKNFYFHNAILKYGWDNFEHKILLENLTKEEAYEKEIEYIAKYNLTDTRYGYNYSTGGDTVSIGSRAKISNSTKGKHHHAFGKSGKDCPNSVVVHQFLKDGTYIQSFDSVTIASKQTNTHQASISECCNNPKRFSAGGYVWSFDRKNVKKFVFVHNVPVIQYTLDNQYVQEWESATIAQQELGIRQTSIAHCCSGDYHHAGGYIWKRKSSVETQILKEQNA